MKNVNNRIVAGASRLLVVGAALVVIGGCALPFASGGGNSGGGGGGGGGGELSAEAELAAANLRADLTATVDDAALIDAIVNGAVGSIDAGTSDTEAILTGLVEGAQRSLGDPSITISDDQQRAALVDTIVSSAVGSIGSLSGGIGASSFRPAYLRGLAADASPRAMVIASITATSVGLLDDAGFLNPEDAADTAPTAAMRALRAAGISNSELASLLAVLSASSVAALGDASLDIDSGGPAIAAIAAALTESIDDSNVEGLDIERDLARLVRQVATGAVRAVTEVDGTNVATGDGVDVLLDLVTSAATGAVRNVPLNPGVGEGTVETILTRLVREVSSGATQAVAQAAVDAGVTTKIDILATVRAVVGGTSVGVNDLKQGFAAAVGDFTNILNEVPQGTAEGAQRAFDDDDTNPVIDGNDLLDLLGELEEELAIVQSRLDQLTGELVELQRQLAELIDAGRQEAANNEPVPELLVSYGTTSDAPIQSGTLFEIGENDTLELDASGSDDEDGDTIEIRWFYDFGEDGAAFFGESPDVAATPTALDPFLRGVTDPQIFATFTRPGFYGFTLSVDDGLTTEEIYFTVRVPGGTAGNQAPTAVATSRREGEADTIVRRTFTAGDTIVLDGGDSSDDGRPEPLDFAWSVRPPKGSTVSVSNPTSEIAGLVPDIAGIYRVILEVDDGELVDEAFFDITVQGPPIADAGANRTSVWGTRIVIDGSNSFDPDGDPITSYAFTVTPANTTSQVGNASLVPLDDRDDVVGFFADKLGEYTVGLTVSNSGGSDSDSVVIDVLPGANAGADRAVAADTIVSLTGSGLVPQGYDVSYEWSVVSVPSGSSLSDSGLTESATAVTFLPDVDDAAYTLRFTVNAFDPAFGVTYSNSDTVVVNVQPAAVDDAPPVANAGSNQVVELGSTVSLSGLGSSDPDGDTLSYDWVLVAKPLASRRSTFSIANRLTRDATFTPDVVGTYTFELTVAANGLTDTDSVRVLVEEADSGGETSPFATLAEPDSFSGIVAQIVGPSGDLFANQLILTDQPEEVRQNLVDGTRVGGVNAITLVLADAESGGAISDGTYSLGDTDDTVLEDVLLFLGLDLGEFGPAGAKAAAAPLDAFEFEERFRFSPGQYEAVKEATVTVATVDSTVTIESWTVVLADGTELSGSFEAEPVAVDAPPEASAGDDIGAAVGKLVTLDGTGSSDPNGDQIFYKWGVVQRPDGASISLEGDDTATPSFTPEVAGRYVFQLTVFTANDASDSDTVTVDVIDSAGPPQAAATVSDSSPTVFQTVALSGTESVDPTGNGLTYAWAVTRAPLGSRAAVASSTSARAEFTPDVAGGYTIALTVSGDSGDSTASVSLSVSPLVTNVAIRFDDPDNPEIDFGGAADGATVSSKEVLNFLAPEKLPTGEIESWTWYLDGTVVRPGDSETFVVDPDRDEVWNDATLDTSGLDPGAHSVTLVVASDGNLYSARISFTVES